MDECSWAYASLALDGCGRILHFRPTHPESFIPSILGGDTATSITEHYRAESVLDTVVSVRERDLLASRVQDFNLYFMLGAAPPRWASAVATT